MIRIDDPYLTLLDFLPESISSDEDIIALSLSIDPELRNVGSALIEAVILPRIAELEEDILNELAWAFNLNNLQLWDDATVAAKRALLVNIFEIRKKSGTRFAVRRIFDLMSVTGQVVEWWEEAAAAYTYRLRLFVDEIGITLDQLFQISELTHRFESTRSKLRQFAVESNRRALTRIYPAVTDGRQVTIGMSLYTVSILARSGMPLPNSQTTGAGQAVYARPFFVPSDVTEVTVTFGNRLISGAVQSGAGDDLTINAAVYTEDGAGGGSGSPASPGAQLSQTVPGNGGLLSLGPFSVTRGPTGKILVAYSIPGDGSNMAFANQVNYGTYATGTDVVDPLPSPIGTDPNPPLWIHVGFRTGKRRIVVFGDSVSVGCTDSFESAAWYLIGLENDFSVSIEGLPGGVLAEFADPVTFTYLADQVDLVAADLVVQAAINSLPSGSTQMIADLTSIVNNARAAGVRRIYVETCGPQGSYPGTETSRLTYNAFVNANSLGVDGVIDIAQAYPVGIADPGDLSSVYASLTTDTTHLNAAGQTVIKNLAMTVIVP